MADASIQTALALGVPTLAVLVGIQGACSRPAPGLVNNSLLNHLRGHLDARFGDMRKTWRGDLRKLRLSLLNS